MPVNNSITPPSFDELLNTPEPSSAQMSPGDTSPRFDDISIASTNTSDVFRWPIFIWQQAWWQKTGFFSVVLSLAALVLFFYSLIRIWQVRRMEKANFEKEMPSAATKIIFGETTATTGHGTDTHTYQKRWRHIENYLKSGTVADWRMAIIEADIMLDELLTARGYTGGSIGEKLKQVNPQQLRSIEEAWSAHKLRNKIAHEGMQTELSEREVKRAMHQYRAVFKEAGLIE